MKSQLWSSDIRNGPEMGRLNSGASSLLFLDAQGEKPLDFLQENLNH